MSLLSRRQPPSIHICCAHCTQPTDISDERIFLTGCCHNPICLECLSKSFPESTFCLICSTLQKHCDDGTLYKHYVIWDLQSYVDWDLTRGEIYAFFEKAKTMPGCSFFLHRTALIIVFYKLNYQHKYLSIFVEKLMVKLDLKKRI
jgi:hypothetical protein